MMIVDIQTPQVPDAMARIIKRNTENKKAKAEHKRKLAEQMEISRGQVLEQYKIKSMLWLFNICLQKWGR